MKFQVSGGAPSFASMLKLICFILAIQLGPALCQEGPSCPFDYLYHFGDGVTDSGNSIYVRPDLTIPAGLKPYGMTYPGSPTGRWSDGRVDFDFTAEDFGLPNIVPYLKMNHSQADSYNGVIFSTARSPVLDRKFFKRRGIVIPPYAVPLSSQMRWFKRHLKDVCNSRTECSEWIGSSLVLMGDIEGNDIGYALTQGKTIEEVRTYVPAIIEAIIDATRETINLGARRVIIPTNGPLGCYPYLLTALQTNESSAYDELGCLKSVNEFAIWKNDYLVSAIEDLRSEFPDVLILDGAMYDGIYSLIANASVIGPNGNSALRSCCGIGGKYNFDIKRFCSDKGVPVCSNPNDHIYWDGMHFTQQTHWDFEDMLVRPALETLNCTPIIDASLRRIRSQARASLRSMDLQSSM